MVVDYRKSDSDFFRSLYICKKIVNMNEGKIIFYENDEKSGTTFEASMQMKLLFVEENN